MAMNMQCQYRSKRCPNVRALKISGKPHRYCIFHRWRANETQRRWVQRKQIELGVCSDSDSSASEPSGPHKTNSRVELPEPHIKIEDEAEQAPVPKRPRVKTTLPASTTQSSLGIERVALSSMEGSHAEEPSTTQTTAYRSVCTPVAFVGCEQVSGSPVYPEMNQADLAIFCHLVLETEEPAHDVLSSADVGTFWWDLNCLQRTQNPHMC